jgi:hypothetical protein
MGTLRCLNKYLFRERKYNNIIERCSENIHVVEIKDCEPLFWRFRGVFIAHEFCPFVKKRV